MPNVFFNNLTFFIYIIQTKYILFVHQAPVSNFATLIGDKKYKKFCRSVKKAWGEVLKWNGTED
jgi:hypothetical protein